MSRLASEMNAAGAKLVPPMAVMGAEVSGWGPEQWMYALTAVYVVLQALYLIWKWVKEARKPDDDEAGE